MNTITKLVTLGLLCLLVGNLSAQDNNQKTNNQLKIEPSVYNRSGEIIGITSTSFDYNLSVYPERNEYTSSLSRLSYSVLDSGIKGPVNNLKLI